MQPPDPRHTIPGNLAPHIPADLYRQLDGQPVVIIQTPHRPRPIPSGSGPCRSSSGLPAAAGLLGVVASAIWIVDYAARTAAFIGSATGPIGLGVSLKLFQSKNK